VNLQRVLEPEVMDTPEEARDYNDMDHSTVNERFVTDLLVPGFDRAGFDGAGFDGADVLDLGTGTALIPVELCRRHADCRVMAVDLSIHMLELARYNIEVAGLIERIELQHVDAKGLPYDDDQFDAVVSNSIVHHIPEPITVLRDAVRVCRSGGRLFFRDLLRPECEAQVKQLVAAYAGEENEHQQQMFDDSLRAALSLTEIRQLIETLGFDPAEVVATSDRHWTWNAWKV
jgi:ubiquinone/menaquinone biosynthesis C-methylase UbiE